MAISIHAVSVPPLIRALSVLSGYLEETEAYALLAGIDPATLISGRLTSEAESVSFEVRSVTDHATKALARIAGMDPPRFADDEATFGSLIERLDRSSMFVRSIKPEQLADARTLTIQVELLGRVERLPGDEYLLHGLMPKVISHLSAVHAILARKGVLVGQPSLFGRLEFLPPEAAT
jgi:hypothetical protein